MSVVLDPIPALGATLDVLRVGPVTAPLPGWTGRVAAPLEVAGPRGRRAVRATDPLTLSSPAFAPGAAARSLLVVGARRRGAAWRAPAAAASAPARRAAWRDVVVPVRAPEGAATLTLDVRPGAAPVELRDLGLVRRATRASACGCGGRAAAPCSAPRSGRRGAASPPSSATGAAGAWRAGGRTPPGACACAPGPAGG